MQEIELAKKNRDDNKIIGKYHNVYLDEYLLGITGTDFVLVGAETGAGKTEFAYNIAFENSKELKVHLFALEADKGEPTNRKLFQIISREYWKKMNSGSGGKWIDLNYRNFITGNVDISEYLEQAEQEYIKNYSNLTIHYREGEFNINTFVKKIKSIEESCDLIVIDHVDYFDLVLGENENSQVSEIMKTLRDVNQVYCKPIVLVSHLRKKSNRDQISPAIEDFMGSSNKSKQVKTVILLGRNYDEDKISELRYASFISVPKSRISGSNNMGCKMFFDAKKNKYEDLYKIGMFKKGHTKFEEMEDKPLWSKSSV